MDVLSEVLRAVKLQGAVFFNAEFSSPWCVRTRPSSASVERRIMFHLLTEGRAYARIPDGARVELTAGDVVIFPHGDAHLLGNGPGGHPVDSETTFAKNLTEGLKLVRFGGGGDVTRFVCGFLSCEPQLSEVFLAGLPPLFVVNIAQEPSGQWLQESIRFSVGQAESGGGREVVLAKLSEVLFVETLRRYINTLPSEQTGWLAGARDPVVGRTLALLHKNTARAWTLASLAMEVGLSRTRLAERFRHFLGEPAMAYLSRWRLRLAAEMLLSTESSVAEIAVKVGYGSEAAFNRAFKREFTWPPAQFRRKRTTAPATLRAKYSGSTTGVPAPGLHA